MWWHTRDRAAGSCEWNLIPDMTGSGSVTLYVPLWQSSTRSYWEPDVQGHCWVCFPLTHGAASCFKIKVLLLYLRGTWRSWRHSLEGSGSYGTSRQGADLWIIWEVSSWRTHKHTQAALLNPVTSCLCVFDNIVKRGWEERGGST